jgi:hypothetical protein
MNVIQLENAVKYAPTLKVPTNAHVNQDMSYHQMAEIVFLLQVQHFFHNMFCAHLLG